MSSHDAKGQVTCPRVFCYKTISSEEIATILGDNCEVFQAQVLELRKQESSENSKSQNSKKSGEADNKPHTEECKDENVEVIDETVKKALESSLESVKNPQQSYSDNSKNLATNEQLENGKKVKDDVSNNLKILENVMTSKVDEFPNRHPNRGTRSVNSTPRSNKVQEDNKCQPVAKERCHRFNSDKQDTNPKNSVDKPFECQPTLVKGHVSRNDSQIEEERSRQRPHLVLTRSAEKRDYVKLKRCLHSFCRQCLVKHCMISFEKNLAVRCLVKDCKNSMHEDEILALLNDGCNVMQQGHVFEKEDKKCAMKLLPKNHIPEKSYGGLKKDYRARQNDETNSLNFKCTKCSQSTKKLDRLEVKKCSHAFCKRCFIRHSRYSSEKYAELRCPEKNCKDVINNEEIKKLLGGDYGIYFSKMIQRFPLKPHAQDKNFASPKNAVKDPLYRDSGSDMQNQANILGDFKCTKCDRTFTIKHHAFQVKQCSHTFCRLCLANHCIHSSNKYVAVRCLARNCLATLDDDEIRELLGDEYDSFSRKVSQRLHGKVMPMKQNAPGTIRDKHNDIQKPEKQLQPEVDLLTFDGDPSEGIDRC